LVSPTSRRSATRPRIGLAGLRIAPKRPTEVRHLSTCQSHRDITRVVYRWIEMPLVHFVIGYDVSSNPCRL
jgi:hypothetical protein